MKTSAITIIFSLILNLNFTNGQEIKKSKISCDIYEYAYKFGEPAKKGVLVEKRSYDSKNRLIKKELYTTVGKKRNYFQYFYYEDGKKEKEIKHSKSGKTISSVLYKYNKNGKQEMIIEYDSKGKMNKKTVFTFNDKKIWIQRFEYDRRDLFEKTINEKFDSKGRRVSGTVYNSDMSVKFKFKIDGHDKFGNELKKIFYKPDDSYYLTYSRKWDEKNNLILKVYEGRYKISYKYDTNNDLISETYYNISTDEPQKLKKYIYTYK